MSAIACLRVSLDANRTDIPVDALGPLVAKYAGAFLEVRWCWPRTYEPLSHYCYLLTDPRADQLDTVELARLTEELELRLFGTAASEALTLLLFEGTEEAISEFSGLNDAGVAELMANERSMPGGGRLSRIAPDGSLSRVPPEAEPPPAFVEAPTSPPPTEAMQGIYFTPQQLFVGDVLTCTPPDAERHISVVDGHGHEPPDAVEFDNACVLAARGLIARGAHRAPLYLPVSFSKLMRPTLRAGYAELLHVLPAAARPRLAATVYKTPRAISYQALRTLHDVLGAHFAAIDLQTADPGFEVHQLTTGAVRSVTLVLPHAKAEVRLAALRRFAARADEFRRRRIWTGVTNIRTRKERDLALDLRAPFITGPAVCRLRLQPVGGKPWPADNLPARSAGGGAEPVPDAPPPEIREAS